MARTKPTPTSINNPYMFRASRNGNVSLVTTAQTDTVVFNAKTIDPNSNFDTTTGLYTVPITGYYLFMAHVRIDSTGATYLQLHIANEKIDDRTTANGQQNNLNGQVLKYLTAGTTVGVGVYHSGGTSTLVADVVDYATVFMGFLIST